MADLPEQVAAQAVAIEAFDAQVQADQQTAAPSETAPQEAPPAAPVAPKPPETVDWEQRYKTLDGKYRKEVLETRDEMRTLKSTVEQLTAQPPKPPETPKPAATPLTDKDTETFGPELIELVTRATTHIVEQVIAPIRDKLEGLMTEADKLKGNLSTVVEVQQGDANSKFWDAVTAAVPELASLNEDQAFLEWCKSRPPGTRTTYQHQINEATAALDAPWMIELLGTYKPAAPQAPVPPARQSVEDLVQPPRSQAPAPPADPADAQRIWSDAEVAKFYADASKGLISRDEVVRIEALIDRATAENRVR